ncbi:GerAB/ArcD/ProY family transporter [Paenibacillus segetis]|uniref:Spore germination protein KB n=1 Tax=Paenibacillus segetis TaxID=1325360 RepID=A0ABQ1Y7N0_9BACL|nr:endospore germination permease [Paenibacillus segetis]GGH15278.1 spore germination protein KB [Paenibacillus segetis]
MASGGKLPVSQGFMLMMMTAGTMNHIMLIPIMLDKSGRDAWITVLVGGIFFIPWVLLVYGIMKKLGNRSLKMAIEESSGKWVRILIMGMISLYLFAFAFYNLKEVIDWFKSTYLYETPTAATTIVLIIICVIAAYSGAAAIGSTAGILLPLSVLFLCLLFIFNTKFMDYSHVLPILEYGITPVIHGLPALFGGLTQIVLFIFIRPFLKENPRLITVVILHLVLILLIFDPIISGLSEFGPAEMHLQRYPRHDQWILVKLGRYIEHIDFLFIFQWLSGAYISVSLCLFLIVEYVFPSSKRLIGIVTIAIILTGLCIAPISNLEMYYVVSDKFLYISAIYTSVLVLLMFFLIGRPNNSHSEKGEHLQ